jgi:hypothetical protein
MCADPRLIRKATLRLQEGDRPSRSLHRLQSTRNPLRPGRLTRLLSSALEGDQSYEKSDKDDHSSQPCQTVPVVCLKREYDDTQEHDEDHRVSPSDPYALPTAGVIRVSAPSVRNSAYP